MAERLLFDDEVMTQWWGDDPITGDAILRTQYKGTEDVLDKNAKLRNGAPKTFKEDGVEFHHAVSVPSEVYWQLQAKLGRSPTPIELIKLSQDRDYSKLRTREVKL